MDNDQYFYLKMIGWICRTVGVMILSVLAYNMFHEYNEAKYQLSLQTERLNHGYITLYDQETHQNVVVRQECK